MTAATFANKDIKPTLVKNDNLVTVALRRDAIARLKQLNKNYVGEKSLDDALERVIALAADTYRQKDKLGLVIDPPQQMIDKDDLDFIKVKIRKMSVSHLNWLYKEYIKAENLGEALEIVIALAGFIYEQEAKGVIKIQRKSDASLMSGKPPFRLKTKPSFRQRLAERIAR